MPVNSQNSKRIEIINADKTYANTNLHPEYLRLVGSIIFKHNNSIMKCDSAHHFINNDIIKAFSNIKINQGDSIKLYGEKLIYNSQENEAILTKDVIFIDNQIQLTTNKIVYDLNNKSAFYPKNGEIKNQDKNISSKKGKYFANKNEFVFNDSVIIKGKNYIIRTKNMIYDSKREIAFFKGPSKIISDDRLLYCENGWYYTKNNIAQIKKNAFIQKKGYKLIGDSIYYNKINNYAKAIQNVYLIDSVENIELNGQKAEYFELLKKTEVYENPILKIMIQEDTLFMRAEKFISLQEEKKNKKVIAHKDVKFFKYDLQGKCDSLIYSVQDSTSEMFVKPVIWSNNLQIIADSIKIQFNQGEIDNVTLRSSPFLSSKIDSIFFNQIKGKTMDIFFKNNNLDKIIVFGNGESLYTIQENETEKVKAINYTKSSNLTLFFKKNQLNSINYILKPDSNTIPIDKINNENKFLKGFLWRGDEKPNDKNDIY